MQNITRTAPARITKSTDNQSYRAVLWKTTGDDDPDRHGDSIRADEFQTQNYMQNPVVLWSHDHLEPIGKATAVWTDGDELKADFVLGTSPKAREVADNIGVGILNAVSVGFREIKAGVLDLMEFSIVSVPANSGALIQRSASTTTTEEIQMDPENTNEILKAPAKIKAAPPVYNLGRALAAQAGLDGIDGGYEREVSQDLQSKSGKTDFQVPLAALLYTKAQSTEPGEGQELTAVSQRGDLFTNAGDAIRNAMVTGQAGARVIIEAEETANVPTMTAGLVPTWQAKDADAADTSATFAAANVTPKHLGARFTIKRSALQYSAHPDISAILQADLRRAIAGELDRVALVGSSATNPLEPDGIWSVVTQSPDVDSVAEMLTFMRAPSEYDEANADMVSVITRNRVLDAFAVTAMGDGIDSAAHVLGSNNLFGRTAYTSKNLAISTNLVQTIVGNFSELLIFLFGDSVGVVMNPFGSAFASGGVEGRMIVDANVLVRSSGAFATANVLGSGLTPSANTGKRK